jgi:ABC-2 type transport system ATP-binding protein
VTVDGGRVEARVADAAVAVPSLVLAASAAGVPLLEAVAIRPTLDDVFLALTGRSLRESGTTTTEEVAA